jgi:hypothetical protein
MPQGIRREPATVQMGDIDSQRDLIPDFHWPRLEQSRPRSDATIPFPGVSA